MTTRIPLREEIIAWLGSPEGKAEMIKAIQQCNKSIAQLNEARQITPGRLNTPMTDFSRRNLLRPPVVRLVEDKELRDEFEHQHAGRNLKRHHLRGTYLCANIAALWNQHKRTSEWMKRKEIK